MSRASNSPGTDDRALTIDECQLLLSSAPRRYLLYGLSVLTTPVSLPRVAEYVTEWTYGVPADDIPEERIRIYLRLYHNHVPRLVDAGVVTYQQDEDMLEPGANLPELEPELERLMEEELTDRHERLFTGR